MNGAVRPSAAGTGHPSDRAGTRKGIPFLGRVSEKGGEEVNYGDAQRLAMHWQVILIAYARNQAGEEYRE